MARESWFETRGSWLGTRGTWLVAPNIGDCYGSKVNNVILVYTQ